MNFYWQNNNFNHSKKIIWNYLYLSKRSKQSKKISRGQKRKESLTISKKKINQNNNKKARHQAISSFPWNNLSLKSLSQTINQKVQ